MDDEVQLALLGAFSAAQHELAPMYTKARELLRAGLLTSTVSLEGLQAETAERESNDELIGDLMRPLARQVSIMIYTERDGSKTKYKSAVIAKDEEDVSALQASVVNVGRRPAFVIGHKLVDPNPKNKKQLVDVLFWSLAEQDPSVVSDEIPVEDPRLFRVRMSYFKFLGMQQAQTESLLSPTPTETLKKLYSHERKTYVGIIGEHISVVPYNGYDEIRYYTPKFKGDPSKPDDLIAFKNQSTGTYSTNAIIHCQPQLLGAMSSGLTDTELADYDVFDSIAKLGLTFGKLNDQRNILKDRLGNVKTAGLTDRVASDSSLSEASEPVRTRKIGGWTVSFSRK